MTDTEQYIWAVEAFTKFLESRNLRKTAERFMILKKAWQVPSHFNVDSLYRALEEDGYHVSLATVYNTIDILCDCGVLRRHQFGTRQALYETVPGNHFHLVCTRCGKVREVKNNELINNLSRRKYSYFYPDYFSATIYGRCSTCLRKIRKEQEQSNR